MRNIFIVLFLALAANVRSQTIDHIGQLKFSNAKIVSTDTVTESICGLQTKAIRLTIIGRTRVQTSCNFGDPSSNRYDTVTNKVYLFYACDITGEVHSQVIKEIKKYVTEQEAWAQQNGTGNDFSYFAFYKSFYVNSEIAIPFIWSGAENPGDYQLFYLNRQVYKVVLVECRGFGNLSCFVDQNLYFVKEGKKMNLGMYVQNIDTAKRILANETKL